MYDIVNWKLNESSQESVNGKDQCFDAVESEEMMMMI